MGRDSVTIECVMLRQLKCWTESRSWRVMSEGRVGCLGIWSSKEVRSLSRRGWSRSGVRMRRWCGAGEEVRCWSGLVYHWHNCAVDVDEWLGSEDQTMRLPDCWDGRGAGIVLSDDEWRWCGMETWLRMTRRRMMWWCWMRRMRWRCR